MIAAASFAFAVVQLDVTIVNVALPPIQEALNTSTSMLQWTVDGYTLSFAVLLLSAGVLSDGIGGRRAYLLGFALFALASAGCGLASNVAWLVGARVVQGIGAALLVPSSLSLINAVAAGDGARRRPCTRIRSGGSAARDRGVVRSDRGDHRGTQLAGRARRRDCGGHLVLPSRSARVGVRLTMAVGAVLTAFGYAARSCWHRSVSIAIACLRIVVVSSFLSGLARTPRSLRRTSGDRATEALLRTALGTTPVRFAGGRTDAGRSSAACRAAQLDYSDNPLASDRIDARSSTDDQQIGRAGRKQTDRDDTGDLIERGFRLHRGCDRQSVHVDDVIAVVGNAPLAP